MDIFETGFLVIVPVGLVLVMFGMGLSLSLDDFRRVFEFPKAALLGIVGQLLLLPALAFALTAVVDMPKDIAVGLIVIAACPGGVASNAIVYAARADVALSVTLTALNSTVTVFSIPFVVSLGLAMHLGDSGTVPDMPILQTMGRLFSITVLPIIIGMLVRARWRHLADALGETFRIASIVILVIIVVGVIGMQIDTFVSGLRYSGPFALLLNLLAMGMGYGLARMARLDFAQQSTIAIEIGLQNGTLAVLVALTLLNMKEVALTPSIYAALMLITGGLFAWLMSRRHPPVSLDGSKEVD